MTDVVGLEESAREIRWNSTYTLPCMLLKVQRLELSGKNQADHHWHRKQKQSMNILKLEIHSQTNNLSTNCKTHIYRRSMDRSTFKLLKVRDYTQF